MHTFNLFTAAIIIALAFTPDFAVANPGIRNRITRAKKFAKDYNDVVHGRFVVPPELMPLGTGVKRNSDALPDDCYVRILHGESRASNHAFAVTPGMPATYEGHSVGGIKYPLTLNIEWGCGGTICGTIPPDYGILVTNYISSWAFMQGLEPTRVDMGTLGGSQALNWDYHPVRVSTCGHKAQGGIAAAVTA
ncbi:hypothetical protein PspLS_07130 [Pyricularia sp. CBS 133598]|nr:hypothetical protein PspLS_07130 [Pyricularia sp. CBS 133598]